MLSRLTRKFSTWGPEATRFYLINPSSDEILGQPRVESTRLQAAARRIAEQFVLGGSTSQAILETEESLDFGPPLHKFVDTSEQALPQLRHRRPQGGDSPLGRWLYAHLSEDPRSLHHVGQFLNSHSVNRLSTYHLLVRRLILGGHIGPAQYVIDSLVMTRRELNWSTLSLALEISRLRCDKDLFRSYADMALQGGGDRFGGSEPTADGVLKLAEGCLQFGDRERLLASWKFAKDRKLISARLLTAMAEGSIRFRNRELAQDVWDHLPQVWDADSDDVVRFLRLANNVPSIHGHVAPKVSQLSPKRQKYFRRWSKYATPRYPNPTVRLNSVTAHH